MARRVFSAAEHRGAGAVLRVCRNELQALGVAAGRAYGIPRAVRVFRLVAAVDRLRAEMSEIESREGSGIGAEGDQPSSYYPPRMPQSACPAERVVRLPVGGPVAPGRGRVLSGS